MFWWGRPVVRSLVILSKIPLTKSKMLLLERQLKSLGHYPWIISTALSTYQVESPFLDHASVSINTVSRKNNRKNDQGFILITLPKIKPIAKAWSRKGVDSSVNITIITMIKIEETWSSGNSTRKHEKIQIIYGEMQMDWGIQENISTKTTER